MTRLIAALVATVATVALLGAGCSSVGDMRREFVALRYMQEAEANLYNLPRETSQAIEELDRAITLMPEDEELARRAARFYNAARAWEKAIPLFEAQDELSRRDRVAYANCLLHTERADEGAQICLTVIDQAREDYEAGGNRPEAALLLNDAGYVLVDADMHVGRAFEAISLAVKAMPLQGAFVDSLGWAHYRRQNLGDAAFYLERALRHSPRQDPEILYHLGVVYGRLGRHRDATDALERAHELAPEWDAVEKELNRLGRILPPPVVAHGGPAETPVMAENPTIRSDAPHGSGS
jgi:tetratricopeptide (TPR) repeat protein